MTLGSVQNESRALKPLLGSVQNEKCARSPTALSRAGRERTETRVWRGTAGHRRASSQEPCDDLDARREPAFHAVVLAPAKLPSHVAFPAPVIPFFSVHRHHSLMNLASHQGIVPLLSERSRNAKTSLGIAPNCCRSAPETPKPRWASLQIAFGASPRRQNLAWHRVPTSPSLRSQQAKIAQGLKRTPLEKE